MLGGFPIFFLYVFYDRIILILSNRKTFFLSHKSSIASMASILRNQITKPEETYHEISTSNNNVKSLQNDTLNQQNQRAARHDTNIIQEENLRQNQQQQQHQSAINQYSHNEYHVSNNNETNNFNSMHQYKNSNQITNSHNSQQPGLHNNNDVVIKNNNNSNAVHTQHAPQDSNSYYSNHNRQQQHPQTSSSNQINITAQQQAYNPIQNSQQRAEYNMYNSKNDQRDQNISLQAQHVQHVSQAQAPQLQQQHIRNSQQQYTTNTTSNVIQSQADNEYFNEDRQQMMLMQSRMRNPNDNIYTTHPPYSES